MKQMTRFLIEEQRRHKHATGNFTALVNDVRLACKRIATLIGKGALAGALGDAGTVNVQGETQKQARRARQRHLRSHQRMGRPARRHGVGGDGRSPTRSRRSIRAASTCCCSTRSTARRTST